MSYIQESYIKFCNLFEYPVKTKYHIPNYNPHSIYSEILCSLFNDEWQKPVQDNISYIKNKFNNHIPIGKKLYHCSLQHDLNFNDLKNKDRITFFGLDIVISLWYILEMNTFRSKTCNGKLYEFVVVKNIPFHILHELTDNPKDYDIYKTTGISCIHPQIAFHGDTESKPPYDLCIELAMNMKYFKDYIEVKQTYIVDPTILDNNKYKNGFNPVDSIIEIEMVSLISL
jgi:hypothetical protein